MNADELKVTLNPNVTVHVTVDANEEHALDANPSGGVSGPGIENNGVYGCAADRLQQTINQALDTYRAELREELQGPAPRAALWIDPARCSGQVCLSGTRLYTSHTAHCLAYGDIAEYRASYSLDDVSDRDIIVAAAWWALREKADNKWERAIKAAWKEWAKQTWQDAWHRDRELTPPPRVPQ